MKDIIAAELLQLGVELEQLVRPEPQNGLVLVRSRNMEVTWKSTTNEFLMTLQMRDEPCLGYVENFGWWRTALENDPCLKLPAWTAKMHDEVEAFKRTVLRTFEEHRHSYEKFFDSPEEWKYISTAEDVLRVLGY